MVPREPHLDLLPLLRGHRIRRATAVLGYASPVNLSAVGLSQMIGRDCLIHMEHTIAEHKHLVLLRALYVGRFHYKSYLYESMCFSDNIAPYMARRSLLRPQTVCEMLLPFATPAFST